MNIKEIQEKIDATDYWDMEVLDLDIKYFGDEVSIVLYDDEESSWILGFLSCYKVQYETDATWRGLAHVKFMKRPQMGYYAQEILVKQNEELEEFVDVKMDLSIMTLNLTCKDITIEKIENDNLKFFWKENESNEN